jgi:ferredoxin/flavodoxin---NADP+ reductase
MSDPARAFVGATLVGRADHAPGLWTVRVRADEPISFEPGQYVSLGLRDGDRTIERPYSIASSPHEDELEFFLELVPHGQLTPRLHELRPGDRLLLRRRAKGTFRLDRHGGRPHHFLAATVTGVAPYVSILRQLAAEAAEGRPPDFQLALVHGASRSWELGYRAELEALAARHARWLRYVPAVSRPWDDAAWRGERGRCEDLLRKYLDLLGMEPGATIAYLCGHPGMIENATGILLRRGFTKREIRAELYWTPPGQQQHTTAGQPEQREG